MVQNVSPDSEDFIFSNYYGARALPRALHAFENEKNADFAYILSKLVEYSSAQRARKCARAQNFFLIVRAKHFRCVLHLERKNFVENSNL